MRNHILCFSIAALIPLNASAASIPQGAQRVELLRFTVEADCGEDALIGSISVRHSGLGDSDDISRIYLAREGRRISSSVSFSNADSVAMIRPRSVTVSACESQSFQILADFSPTAASGGQHRLTIDAIAARTGSVHSASITKAVQAETTPSEAEGISIEYRPVHGSVRYGNNRTVSRMRIESDASFDQEITSIMLTNAGSAKDGDLVNIRLFDGEMLIAPAVRQMDDDTITFVPDPAFRLRRGDSVLLTVKADIRGRAKRTINLVVDEPSDIEAMRQQRSR